MKTILVPQQRYEIMEQQAALYREVLKKVAKDVFPTELYSEKRLIEFLKEDRVNAAMKRRVQKIFRR